MLAATFGGEAKGTTNGRKERKKETKKARKGDGLGLPFLKCDYSRHHWLAMHACH